MSICRPKLVSLGGKESFRDYQREFDRLYRSGPVLDVLGRLIEFPEGACRHVCFKSSESDCYGQGPRDTWSQERAERISWIEAALSDPATEIRPHLLDPGKQVYLPSMDGEHGPREWFFVVVVRIGAEKGEFVTAYPVPYHYWSTWRKGGRRIYPPPAQKFKKAKRHNNKGQGV